MDTRGDIVSAGVDYMSMTMPNNNLHYGTFLRASQAYLEEIAAAGNEVKSMRRLGYEGYSVGGSFVGERERDCLSLFSGERAKRAYTLLYRAGVHVSRIDVQTSFRYTPSQSNVAQMAREQVNRDNVKLSSARQRNATLIEDLRGGATCYIGTRKSEQFARIYNKGAESGEAQYEGVWRFEVQLKNRLASKAAEQIGSGVYNQEGYASVFVKQWLRHRGVSTPWKADAELLPLPKEPNTKTQLEEKLEWLRTQVRPALRVLLKYGLRDDILAALGLDEASNSKD